MFMIAEQSNQRGEKALTRYTLHVTPNIKQTMFLCLNEDYNEKTRIWSKVHKKKKKTKLHLVQKKRQKLQQIGMHYCYHSIIKQRKMKIEVNP